MLLGPSVAGSLVAGSVVAGSVVAGSLVAGGEVAGLVTGGALVVAGGGGAPLVTGALLGGEAVEGGGLGGLLDFSGDGEPGAVLDDGGDDDTPGLPLDEDGGGEADSPGRPPDDPVGPWGPDFGGVLVGGVFAPEEGGGGVVVGPLSPPEVLVPPPATVSITYCPNGSSAPAGGSVAVTFAPSDGTPCPAYPAASPASISTRLAPAKVVPARFGTVRRFFVLNVVSVSPVLPTGRSMPRAGSWTSTRAIRASFRGAGFTATTDSRWYPAHFLLPSSNWTEIRPVSPSKGRNGFPHEHFTAGSPCSSTRIEIPAWSKELYGTAFSFL
ncbi:hypothetical protein AQI96_27795 [Streptomyces canus]|nr:hypothetical protein AQI96_27795 [Streptomyces canus]